MAATYAPLAFDVGHAFRKGRSSSYGEIEHGFDNEVSTLSAEDDSFSIDMEQLPDEDATEDMAFLRTPTAQMAAAVPLPRPLTGTGTVAQPYLDTINNASTAFAPDKVVAFLWLLAVPFWPTDAIVFLFAFSVFLIALDRSIVSKSGNPLEGPKQFAIVVAQAVTYFWIAGIGDYLVNAVVPLYNLSAFRYIAFGWFIWRGLRVLAKVAFKLHIALSKKDDLKEAWEDGKAAFRKRLENK